MYGRIVLGCAILAAVVLCAAAQPPTLRGNAASPNVHGHPEVLGPFHKSKISTSENGAIRTTVVKYGADERRSRLMNYFTSADVSRFPAPKHPESKWCPENSYFQFIPAFLGQVRVGGDSPSGSGMCFRTLSFEMGTPTADDGVVLTVTASDPVDLSCAEAVLFGTREHFYYLEVLVHGSHELHISKWEANELADVSRNGVSAFYLPCGVEGTIESVYKTVTLFDSKDLTAVNVDFLSRVQNRTFVPFGKHVKPDKSAIKSGDYLAIARLDGLDPLVMYGTGGTTGHSAIAVWDNGTLYVCESTDKNPFGKVYWPPPYGVIRTPFDQWFSQAIAADYHVAMLPISQKYGDAFDEARFWAWFAKVEGLPYGYHNFLYSFVDTFPMHNLPEPFDPEGHLYETLMHALDRLISNTSQVNVYSLVTVALNKRLNTSCTSMECIGLELDRRNLTLGEVSAIPENDEWVYYDGYSMVCSVFAFEGWKAGLGSVLPPISGTEQTPKDNYMANLFDGEWFTDDNCPGGVQHTPNGTYCQLMGTYVQDLPGYNSVPIYAHMNDNCPSQWPSYFRCPVSNPSCC